MTIFLKELSRDISVDGYAERLSQFAADRDWEGFHTPKNLAMALAGEAGELLEIFQWLSPEESSSIEPGSERWSHAAEELADILQYVIRVADLLEIDLADALDAKLVSNAKRYPVDEVRGRAEKRD